MWTFAPEAPLRATSERSLRLCAEANFRNRLLASPILAKDFGYYEARLRYELDEIARLEAASGFLWAYDLVRLARDRGFWLSVQEGAGAGSLVAWGLGITDPDPLKYGLSFEWFIHEDRSHPPQFIFSYDANQEHELLSAIGEVFGVYGERLGELDDIERVDGAAISPMILLRPVKRPLPSSVSIGDVTVPQTLLDTPKFREIFDMIDPSTPDRLCDVIALAMIGDDKAIRLYYERSHGLNVGEWRNRRANFEFQETFGIPLYQEQVARVLVPLLGKGFGEIDTALHEGFDEALIPEAYHDFLPRFKTAVCKADVIATLFHSTTAL